MNPYPHQQAEVEGFAHWPRRALFWSPRIGKSLGSVLSLEAGVPSLSRGIVIAPYGVCGQWARFLESQGYAVARLYATPVAQALQTLVDHMHDKTIVVVNYQRLGLDINKKTTLADALVSWGAQALIIDESHYIVSPSADWARAARKLAWNIPWVRCLSGTPAPNHYGNLWGQLSALNPNEFGWAYKHFADRWLVTDRVYPSQVYGYKNFDEELAPLIKRYCSFVRREDVFGPDQWIENVRTLELPPKASRLYAKLAREWLIDDEDESLRVDGTHILTRLIRLQQLACGFIQDEHTSEIKPIHTVVLDAVESDLDEIIATGEKAIVFHRFTWEGDEMVQRLRKRGVRTLVVRGDVKSEERDEVQRAIEQDPGPIVAVVQTQSGGIGVSYAKAAYALVMSQSFSFVQEEQARDRIYERAQDGAAVPKHIMYYRCEGTVHEFIAERIALKEYQHDNLTQINRQDMAFGSYAPRRKLKVDMVPTRAYD